MLSACFAAALAPAAVRADEGTQIASSFEESDPFDLFVGVRYRLENTRTSIKREYPAAGPDEPYRIVKDLYYKKTRHIVEPRIAIGIFRDLQLSVDIPVIVHDSRELDFDQRADDCVFSGPEANCIDAGNSRTVQDGLLPPMGFDSEDPAAGFPMGSSTVFRGPDRAGLDQVHLGVAWAALNQAKDDTKPTWVLGAELRLSVGEIMRFDRQDPEGETGVSRGVHEFRAYTGFSRRTSWAEPFVYFWWQAPIGTRGDDPNDPDGSLFWDLGFGQDHVLPPQKAGTVRPGRSAWPSGSAAAWRPPSRGATTRRCGRSSRSPATSRPTGPWSSTPTPRPTACRPFPTRAPASWRTTSPWAGASA